MPIRCLYLLDRTTTALFALTIIFSFCGLFLVPAGQSIESNLLAVTGIFGLLNYFVGKQQDAGLKDRRILWGLVVYAAMIFVNRLIHGDQYGVMRGLFYVVIFALMMPRKPILLMLGYLAIVLGGMGLGILSIWQYQHGIARVEGFTNAILFSQAALTLAILNWFVFQQRWLPRWFRRGALIGLIAALFALYLSQSRGVWLALGVILAYVICYKAYFKPWKYVAVAILCSGHDGRHLSYQSAGSGSGRGGGLGYQLGRKGLVRFIVGSACHCLAECLAGFFWIRLWQEWALMASTH